jgi:hypothetical protein
MIERPPVGKLSASEIADEITRTRARLSRVLALIDREYALRNIFVHGLRAMREAEIDRAHLLDEVRAKAVPFAIIGVGFAWLTLDRTRGAGLVQRLSRALADMQNLARHLIDTSRP